MTNERLDPHKLLKQVKLRNQRLYCILIDSILEIYQTDSHKREGSLAIECPSEYHKAQIDRDIDRDNQRQEVDTGLTDALHSAYGISKWLITTNVADAGSKH